MATPIDLALADPWSALRFLVGGPLHPGGEAATETLLSRAGVGEHTRVLDIGCGAGNGVALARDRGATAVGLDRRRSVRPTLVADFEALPVESVALDVVLAECVFCLADDFDRAIAEAVRVLRPGGRLALSDVVVEAGGPDVPAPIDRVLCLDGARGRADLLNGLERAGLDVGDVVDHREALRSMRDRAADRVDYAGLLRASGERGRRLLDGIESVERAIDDGSIGYVSVVACRPS